MLRSVLAMINLKFARYMTFSALIVAASSVGQEMSAQVKRQDLARMPLKNMPLDNVLQSRMKGSLNYSLISHFITMFLSAAKSREVVTSETLFLKRDAVRST